MTQHIAVDIGGTQMRAARYHSESLTPEKLSRISTQAPNATPLERLQELIASVWPEDEPVAGIAAAAPGPLDPYLGIVMAAPNIPGWIELPLRRILEERFHVPVAVGNDANLAAMGEWKFGAGQGHHHLIYITISTGIGGGVIINDQLLLGAHGLAGELGHVTVLLDGPVCGCGHRGHLEAVASGTAIAGWVQQEIAQGAVSILPQEERITGRMISSAAKQGDELAVAALARAGTFMGMGLANFAHIFNPSIIIIGGGVSQSGHFLLKPMYTALRENVITPQYVEGLTITTASLGDEAGLLGALALARSLSPE